MAKITAYIPEPKEEYQVDNQRQILESVSTLKDQLNFSFQNDLKEEQDSYMDASNVDADLYLKKFGGSDVEIGHAQLNKNSENMIVNTLNLEAGDVIKMQADTADKITGAVSYALIDRSQENG